MARLVVLALLAAAFIGPWAYNADGVPPPEYCAEPNFLLTPERCVSLLPGTEILAVLGSFFIALPSILLSGGFSIVERGSEMLTFILMTLLLLPFVSTLVLLLARITRRLLVFEMAAWGLAAIPALMYVFLLPDLRTLQLWGIWLFIGLAAAMLILGMVGLITRRRAGVAGSPA